MYLLIKEAKQTVLIIEACNCYNPTYKILSNILLPRLTPLDKIIRDYQCGFRRIHNCLSYSSVLWASNILEKMDKQYGSTSANYRFQEVSDSVRMKMFCMKAIGIPTTVVELRTLHVGPLCCLKTPETKHPGPQRYIPE